MSVCPPLHMCYFNIIICRMKHKCMHVHMMHERRRFALHPLH